MAQQNEKKAKATRPQRQKPTGAKPAEQRGTKKALCLKLLARRHGASVPELQEALGWQSHSVRGFLSGTAGKLDGHRLETIAVEGKPRRYKMTKTTARA